MRPISLQMTAFGSYAEKTTVPFDSLRQGLYLVTGDTGAGKTTIFDAIVFALYGVASGSERTVDMLHSDYVSKAVDTEVELCFEQRGKKYRVCRTIHYPKNQKVKGEYRDAKVSAVLEEPDREPTEVAGKVTSRCEEILGLNEQQFRKIIMLAQGEFREFLKADSDKKSEILGRLFDNSDYVWYRDLLSGARDVLKERRSSFVEQERTAMQTLFRMPDDLQPGDELLYMPGSPELLDNLTSLIAGEADTLQSLQSEKKAVTEKIKLLSEQKGAAEGTNRLLDELDSYLAHAEELSQLQEQMQDQRETAARVEKALHRAYPAVEDSRKAAKALKDAEDRIENLKESAKELGDETARAQEQVEADAEAKAELTDTELQIRKIDAQMPLYQELAATTSRRKEAEDAAKAADDILTGQKNILTQKRNEISALEIKIQASADIDSTAEMLKHWSRRAEELQQTFSSKKGLKAAAGELCGRIGALEKEKERLLHLMQEAQLKEQNSHALYQRFLAGQAGLLAQELRIAVQETGRGICRVCGSEISGMDLHQLAELPEATPDQADVDRAKKQAAQAEQNRSDQNGRTERLAADIEARKDNLVTSFRSWLSSLKELTDLIRTAEKLPLTDIPAEDTEQAWNLISDGNFLAEAESLVGQIVSETGSRSRAADKVKRQRKQDMKDLASRREEADKASELIDRYNTKKTDLIRQADVCGERISQLIKQLPYETKELAEAKREEMHRRSLILKKQIDTHQKALEEAGRKLNTCMGSLESEKGRLPELNRVREEADLSLQEILLETGFEDSDQVLQTLSDVGDKGEAWLADMRRHLNEYENDCRNTQERISALQVQTEGKTRTDLQILVNAQEQAAEENRRRDELLTQQRTVLENHRDVYNRCRAARQELSSSENAWRRLDRLADLAVGTSGDGGKLSFDRYVMGAVFREVLEMANRRLDNMSGGRYELVHRTETDRKNSKAGLEIDILDNSTGQTRSSGSLSGGEAFFTSLALALGLSDVVQNHAGGKQLDTLFIDEGFGSLSEDVLDKALDVLGQLTEGNRLVGIISHVDRLDESIPQKIRVRNTREGSTISIELP